MGTSEIQDSEVLARVVVDEGRCRDCGFCTNVNVCHSPRACVGCLSCYRACPYEARRIVHEGANETADVWIDGVQHDVPSRITIKRALELCGHVVGIYPGEGVIQAPCSVGGCYACMVEANGEPVRACITPISDGMRISTMSDLPALRVIHGPQPHSVGGKATPWWIKGRQYIEVAIWAAGCNLRCRQCQNFAVTYDNSSKPVSPREAAELLTSARRRYGVDRMSVSGGEPTTNRRWLIEFFKELRALNRDKRARLHLDSNGTLLTEDYIAQLIRAGVTDMGVEPKGLKIETFMKITGIRDEELARRFSKTQWRALEYLADEHSDRVFVGVGIPYNGILLGLEELQEIGSRIASIDPSMQVVVLDYFPTFRRRDLVRPSPREMLKVKGLLNEAGLETVIVQTSMGHYGP